MSRMAIAALLATGYFSTACGPPQQSNSDWLFESAKQSQAASAKAQADQEARLQEQLSHTQRPLDAFRKESKTAATCRSKHLADARVNALALMLAAGEKSDTFAYAYGLSGMQRMGSLALDVADAAARASCREMAREIYDTVIRIFVGSGYAAIRQRAEIGINDLRGSTSPKR